MGHCSGEGGRVTTSYGANNPDSGEYTQVNSQGQLVLIPVVK